MRTLATLVPLLPISALAAQTYRYSPPHIASTEGRRATALNGFGTMPAARYQFLTGDLRGQAGAVREVAFRHDYQSVAKHWGDARTFRDVKISMADGDLSTFGQGFSWSFASNLKSSSTTVFRAPVTFPTILGYPASKPAPWGGPKGGLAFPFKTPFVTAGQKDLIVDFDMQGGKLANSIPWKIPAIYQLDSWQYDSHSGLYNAPGRYLPAGQARCNDSALGQWRKGASIGAAIAVYGPQHAVVNRRNQLVMSSQSLGTAPLAPVIHAWGLNADVTGTDVGAGCHRLHMKTIVYLQMMTTSSAAWHSTSAFSPPITVPWTASLGGVEVVLQGAWADSSTRQFSLTQSQVYTLPNVDFGIPRPRRAAAYDWYPTLYGPYLSLQPSENPNMRLRQ